MYSTRYAWQILMKSNFLDRFYKKKKSLNIKFHQYPSRGSRVPRGRTDRHDKANIHFSQFGESTWKLKCVVEVVFAYLNEIAEIWVI
jgi:hypothetical protein